MNVIVYGPGCANCQETEKLVRKAAAATGRTDIAISHVTDFKEMLCAGVLTTPAVTVDGVLKCSDRVPELAEMTAWLAE